MIDIAVSINIVFR